MPTVWAHISGFIDTYGQPWPRRFGDNVEAFQYVLQHQEERNARGFATMFFKSLGMEDLQNTSRQTRYPAGNRQEDTALVNAESIWLNNSEQPSGQLRQPVEPTLVELDGAFVAPRLECVIQSPVLSALEVLL